MPAWRSGLLDLENSKYQGKNVSHPRKPHVQPVMRSKTKVPASLTGGQLRFDMFLLAFFSVFEQPVIVAAYEMFNEQSGGEIARS